MTPRSDIVFLSLELGLEEVAGELRRTWRTRVPVYRENRDNIVGILHARDLLAIDMADWVRSGTGVESLLREPLFVPESKPVTELLHAFWGPKAVGCAGGRRVRWRARDRLHRGHHGRDLEEIEEE